MKTLMNNQQELTENIIKEHVLWSLGAGLVPIPVLDVLAVTAIQLDMLKQISRVYAQNYSESSGKAMLSAVTGSTFARIGASMIKAIPGIGTILGTVSMPILSGASTYAIGKAVSMHFESGGDFFNINFDSMKQAYDDWMGKGKEVAQSLQKRQKNSSQDTIKRLEELMQLKEKGVITEEEFERKKQELLTQL